MCFSAEASFSAALVLGVIGGATIKRHLSSPYFFLAAVPFLFAIQQFSEGLIWLHLTRHMGSEILFKYAQYTFLTFAFLIWPIWIPLSLAWIEHIRWRRQALWFLFCAGIILSLANLFYALQQEISVNIIHHSLHYQGRILKQMFVYPVIVLLPCFISSLNKMWIFGILVAAAYAAAAYFYLHTFVSVWCFFAAIVSLLIYGILKHVPSSSDTPRLTR